MRWIFICVIIIAFLTSKAQNNIGIGTITPNQKSILDLTSTEKGFLVPRMTSTERIAINPTGQNDVALLVYDTDEQLFYYWNSIQWIPFPNGSNNISLQFDTLTHILSITDAGGALSATIPPDDDVDPTNEFQILTLNGQVLTISNGNSVTLTDNVNDADADSTNELQNISQSLSGTDVTIQLSDANSITFSIADPDADPTNEQNIALQFDSISNLLQLSDAGGTLTANLSSLQSNDWKLEGNTGTTPATNYIGTTDNAGLSIRTNGIERMLVASTGDVGINRTLINDRLHVGGSIRIPYDEYIVFGNTNNVTDGGGGERIGNFSSDGINDFGLEFQTTFQNKMVIRQNGYVGILYDNPTARLHVADPGDIELRISPGSPIGGGGSTAFQARLRITGENDNTGEGFVLRYDNLGTTHFESVYVIPTPASPSFQFLTNTNGTADSAISIFPNTNISIGTANYFSNSRLTVFGDNGTTVPYLLSLQNDLPNTGMNNTTIAIDMNDIGEVHWTMYVGGANGYFGVGPRNYEIWEYPTPAMGANCCRRRFVIESTYNDPITLPPNLVLQANGNVATYGAFVNLSDARYKKEINGLTGSLDNIQSLKGVSYTWNRSDYADKFFTDRKQIGLIAQEVRKVFPELVYEDADGYLTVDYVKLIPILIEAIKEQQMEIEELAKRKQNESIEIESMKLFLYGLGYPGVGNVK